MTEINKVFQTNFTSTNGNCFQACLATIMGIPLDQAPNFAKGPGPCDDTRWRREWNHFNQTNRHGIRIIDMVVEEDCYRYTFGDSTIIATGESPRDVFCQHSVVWRNMEMIHDPFPDGTGIVGYPYRFTIITYPTPALFGEPIRAEVRKALGKYWIFHNGISKPVWNIRVKWDGVGSPAPHRPVPDATYTVACDDATILEVFGSELFTSKHEALMGALVSHEKIVKSIVVQLERAEV